jgi:hypothetical protein
VKVGIIQSNYIPWRGYFDFIDSVDLFIFHDDLQYTKDDWRNRNKIKTSKGTMWLTVPVRYKHTSQKINETTIDYSQDWVRKHLLQLKQWYETASHFETYFSKLENILQTSFESISALNIALCHWIMSELEITTPTRLSHEFQPHGSKTERLIDLLKKVNATTYLSGPNAKNYLNETPIYHNDIILEYKTYNYPAYEQLWGEFAGNVSVLDLLFNVGPKARNYLKSREPRALSHET